MKRLGPRCRWMIPLILSGLLLAAGCISPQIHLLSGGGGALREVTLEGRGRDKVLMIPVTGVTSDGPRRGLIGIQPGRVPEIVARLRKAETDPAVGAGVLKIDSPGGSATASDLLYHEILRFKDRTGIRVVAALMNVAASGGYYVALPADRIIAHPTTVTGSVGVILMRPTVAGLMDKLGVAVSLNKSGENKDMGSPFREITAEEQRMLQLVVERLAGQFLDRVIKHREIDKADLGEIASARIFLAEDARVLGLIDGIGYLDDAVTAARELAGLPPDARVVAYRRREIPDDTVYGPAASAGELSPSIKVPGLDLPTTGFYYLWPAAVR